MSVMLRTDHVREVEYFTRHCSLASMELVKQAVDTHSAIAFVWPDEGEFREGTFIFNDKHSGYEPLILDATTANMLLKVHDALSPENAGSFARFIAKNRGRFAQMVEFGWGRFS